jgi:glycosyltransferase involved in cell wall biosynthesis
MPDRISGFVIAYNRQHLIETCLRSIRFVDELIVIDKSSTDHTARCARRYADRVVTVAWSPTVEETRAFALTQCSHPWIAFLDDDEMLSPEAICHLRHRPAASRADAVLLPLRHYILGRHDTRAYYAPEHHMRFFRRGAVNFGPTVHGGIRLQSDHVERIAADSSICVHHLSHSDAAQWIERTNRYTSRPDRLQAVTADSDLIDFAHRRIDHWLARTEQSDRNDYPAAVALLRAVYDMVDRIKSWEASEGVDGERLFAGRCAELCRGYDELERRQGISTGMRRGKRAL